MPKYELFLPDKWLGCEQDLGEAVGGAGLTKKWSAEHVWISDCEEEEEEEEQDEAERGFRVLFYGRRELEIREVDDELDSYRSSSPFRGCVSRFEID